ncbi:guanine-1-methyltransferase-domain-containing protein [Tribonema minus]|uniref:tRNA (guanine(9)-N(1))-methyltransferase n=1 Tax=Tribonema minus TaxID=303371 RepID=A0A835Z9S5_9STRA|nr:guanine-1-methyltransferase-domain-containing protein [Tribonema minus]
MESTADEIPAEALASAADGDSGDALGNDVVPADTPDETPANGQGEGVKLTKNELRRQRKIAYAKEKKQGKKQEKREAREQKEKELLAAGKDVPWLKPQREREPGEKTFKQPCDVMSLAPVLQRQREDMEKRAKASGYRVILDMAFFELMNQKERVAYCYSSNRKAEVPTNLYLTGINKEAHEMMQRCMGFSTWAAFQVQEKCYMDTFAKEDLVYLTADSNVELQRLDPTKAYIVGAFVDKNRHKGITAKKAVSQGIATGRLPLDKYLNMKGTKVLTVNHVYDILLQTIASGGDFKAAIEAAVPGRKCAEWDGVTRATKRKRQRMEGSGGGKCGEGSGEEADDDGGDDDDQQVLEEEEELKEAGAPAEYCLLYSSCQDDDSETQYCFYKRIMMTVPQLSL